MGSIWVSSQVARTVSENQNVPTIESVVHRLWRELRRRLCGRARELTRPECPRLLPQRISRLASTSATVSNVCELG